MSFQDHIQEIVNKWHSIDDEIWAKIICMERNRRIAKAYARKHTISINGSRDDYLDGTTLGLNSFENPDRDSKTSYIKQFIGEGVKIKINQNGDIFIKRFSRTNVFVHQFRPATSRTNKAMAAAAVAPIGQSQSSSDLYAINSSEGSQGDFYGIVRPKQLDKNKRRLKGKANTNSGSSSGAYSETSPSPAKSSESIAAGHREGDRSGGRPLQLNKVFKLFSINKFKRALELEARKSVPNRTRLQSMCISVVSFVLDDRETLNLPSWVMIFNIVAMDLLASEIGLVEPYDLPLVVNEMASARHWKIAESCSNLEGEYLDYLAKHDYENDNEEEETDFEVDESHCGAKPNPDPNSKPKSSKNLINCHDEFDQHQIKHQIELSTIVAGKQGPTNSIEQLGSSSSGFASSNQNEGDSELNLSANSSTRSNVPTTENEHSTVSQALNSSRLPLNKLENNNNKEVRGKRFPKLPHGISNHCPGAKTVTDENVQDKDKQVIMSRPIPIPAPPTSAGGPTGKANLILVSPTGLSRLAHKKVYALNAQALNAKNYRTGAKDNILPQLAAPLSESAAKQGQRLPQGIPPHAQLAPPAARKHILRYLMSTAQPNGADQRPPPPLRKRLQRPLPGLPGARLQQQPTDEGLYYRGLQARAMQAGRPQQRMMMMGPVYGQHRLAPRSLPPQPQHSTMQRLRLQAFNRTIQCLKFCKVRTQQCNA